MCAQMKPHLATNATTDRPAIVSFKRHLYWIIEGSIYSNFIIS
jgi:hypothetical protein